VNSKQQPTQGRTLWERISGSNKPVPVEQRYTNPANVKIGDVMSVNTIDHSHLLFTVKELWQWTRVVNGNQRLITDYKLLTRPHDGNDVEIIVRVIPRENPDPLAKYTHHFCVLRKFFECGWQDEAERNGILEAVSDPAGELVYQRGEPNEERFWRINSKLPYDCDVAVIADMNGDGKIEESEVTHARYKLWDFHRETRDEANQPITEYLFVHQDQDNKDFVMWRGKEVDPTLIRA
jgi:hypothetical protein